MSSAVLRGQVYRPGPLPATMDFGQEVARLGRSGLLALLVRHEYRIVESETGRSTWRITTASYAYRLQDLDERLVVSYHWHPDGRSRVTTPHLHVGGRTAPVDLSKAHLPTGFVGLPAVIRMAITELGVEPLRKDWRDALAQAERSPTP